jgi:hypothetical protein
MSSDSAAALQLQVGQAVAAAEQHHQQWQYAQGPVDATPVLLQLQKLHSSLAQAVHKRPLSHHTVSDAIRGTDSLRKDQLRALGVAGYGDE